MKEKNKNRKSEEENPIGKSQCNDRNCPFHGKLSARGRIFQGTVIKKFLKRIVLEFERTIYIKKYERYAKARTKIHAHLQDCLADEIKVGDYVQVRECRPLSKIIHFVVMKKIRDKEEDKGKVSQENRRLSGK